MKKFLIILLASGVALGASAQKFAGRSHYYARPRVIVSTGIYNPFFPYYGYYGYPYFGYAERPTRLDLKIDDIQNDYKEKIQDARHDKSVPRKERRENVRLLKHERDQAIIQAKRDYYKPKALKQSPTN